jgi:hypothetical protein
MHYYARTHKLTGSAATLPVMQINAVAFHRLAAFVI